MVYFLFLLFELFLFFLPILPPQWYLRFFIALVYFIGHQYKVQHLYLNYKNKYLPKKELPYLQKELPIEDIEEKTFDLSRNDITNNSEL